MTYGSISQAFIDKFTEQPIEEWQIELGIKQTTGSGNTIPSPYHVLSYLLNFDIIPCLMGRSAFNPIKTYIALKYHQPAKPLDSGDIIPVVEHFFVDSQDSIRSNYGNPI